jgi:osmotically-inducible protein OsmY
MVIMASCKQGPTDAQLHDQIAGMINPTSPGVTVTVNDGVVTLGGTCPDESCKHVSESAAKGIKGVKQVVNNIVVSPPAAQPHVEITADDPLKDSVNSLLSAYKTVKANVENGTVTLTGEIKRSQLTPLMQSVNELKPKKVVNNLVIK